MGLEKCYRSGLEGRPGWRIGFPYDRNLVERLKKVPHTHRAWDPVAHEWWVSTEYESTLLEIFGSSFEVHLRQPSLF